MLSLNFCFLIFSRPSSVGTPCLSQGTNMQSLSFTLTHLHPSVAFFRSYFFAFSRFLMSVSVTVGCGEIKFVLLIFSCCLY